MKHFEATQMHLRNMREDMVNAGDKFINSSYENRGLTAKFKSHLKGLLMIMQTVVIWSMFLYIPLYAGLLYMGIITFISMFILYCFVIFFVILMGLIIVNFEEHTFK